MRYAVCCITHEIKWSFQNTLTRLEKDVKAHQTFTNNELKEMRDEMSSLMARIAVVEKELEEQKSKRGEEEPNPQLSHLYDRLNYMERKHRENNIRLIGVPETYREDCLQIVHKIVQEELGEAWVEVAHQTGRRQENRPRHNIFCVLHTVQKNIILQRQRDRLQERPYFLVEDLTKTDYMVKRSLKPEID